MTWIAAGFMVLIIGVAAFDSQDDDAAADPQVASQKVPANTLMVRRTIDKVNGIVWVDNATLAQDWEIFDSQSEARAAWINYASEDEARYGSRREAWTTRCVQQWAQGFKVMHNGAEFTNCEREPTWDDVNPTAAPAASAQASSAQAQAAAPAESNQGGAFAEGETIKAGTIAVTEVDDWSTKTSVIFGGVLVADFFVCDKCTPQTSAWTNFTSVERAQQDACVQAEKRRADPVFAGFKFTVTSGCGGAPEVKSQDQARSQSQAQPQAQPQAGSQPASSQPASQPAPAAPQASYTGPSAAPLPQAAGQKQTPCSPSGGAGQAAMPGTMVPKGWAAVVEVVDFQAGVIDIRYYRQLPVDLAIGARADNTNIHVNAWTSCGPHWTWSWMDTCGQAVEQINRAKTSTTFRGFTVLREGKPFPQDDCPV